MAIIGSTPDTAEGRFISAVVQGDAEAAKAGFAGEPRFDDPFKGFVEGDAALDEYIAELPTLFKAERVDIEFHEVTKSGDRSATEFEFTRFRNNRHVTFNGIVVADLIDGKIDAVRIYYRRVDIDDTQTYRRYPVLTEERPDNAVLPAVAEYIEVLRTRDTRRLASLFEEDGYFNLFKGKEELSRVFDRVFAARTNGVQLAHPNAFVDGATTCIEFNSTRDPNEPPHPGVAFYVVGPTGKLKAARPLDE